MEHGHHMGHDRDQKRSLNDDLRRPLTLDVLEVLVGTPLYRPVLAGGLHDLPKLFASRRVVGGIDVTARRSAPAHRLVRCSRATRENHIR